MLSLQKRYLVVCGAVAVARSSPSPAEFAAPSLFNAFFEEANGAFKMAAPSALAEWVLATDKNKDEALQESELGALAFKHLDANGDGAVSREEMSMAKALALFSALDADADGELMAGEVPQAFIDIVENLDGFVENNDGKLDSIEFANFHAKVKPKPKKAPVSWAEVAILGIAGGMACVAAALLYQSWRKSTSSGGEVNSLLGVENYELDYPPEVAAFQELRDSGEADEIALKRALFKRALATVPMRLYIQAEEKNVQRMYHNSMISPESWANFQQCIEDVKVEMEVIKEEAEAKKAAVASAAAAKAEKEAKALSAEKEASDRKKAIAALEKEAEAEATKKGNSAQKKKK